MSRRAGAVSALRRAWPWLAAVLVALAVGAGIAFAWLDPRFDYLVDDGHNHADRVGLFDALLRRDGASLYPRWWPDLSLGYGYPLLTFYSPGVYYLAETVHLLGASTYRALHLVAFGAVLLGTGGAFALGAITFRSPLAALVLATVYAGAPYPFVTNLYNRSAFPEAMGLAVLPWLLVAGTLAVRRPGALTALALALCLAALVLLHNLSALVGAAVLALWAGATLLDTPGRGAGGGGRRSQASALGGEGGVSQRAGGGAGTAGGGPPAGPPWACSCAPSSGCPPSSSAAPCTPAWAPAGSSPSAPGSSTPCDRGRWRRRSLWLSATVSPRGRSTSTWSTPTPRATSRAPSSPAWPRGCSSCSASPPGSAGGWRGAASAPPPLARPIPGSPGRRACRWRGADCPLPGPLRPLLAAQHHLVPPALGGPPPLAVLQFPWRLYGPLALALAFAGAGIFAWLAGRGQQQWILALLLATFVVVNGRAGHTRDVRQRDPDALPPMATRLRETEGENTASGTTSGGEFLPRSVVLPDAAPRGLELEGGLRGPLSPRGLGRRPGVAGERGRRGAPGLGHPAVDGGAGRGRGRRPR